MTKDEILEMMRQNADMEPLWAMIRTCEEPGRASSAILSAFRESVSKEEQAGVIASAKKAPESSGKLYFEAALTSVRRMRHDKDKARRIAHTLAAELADTVAAQIPQKAPEPINTHEAGFDNVFDGGPSGEHFIDTTQPAPYPEIGDDVPFGDAGPEPLKPSDFDQGKAAIMGEPVRRAVPESEIARPEYDDDRPESAGFSPAEVPAKRPASVFMLPPPPSADADPDEISAWAASKPVGDFSIGYEHAPNRGPKDADVMDAEVAFYNGPEVIMKDSGRAGRLDGEDPKAATAAAIIFSGNGEAADHDEQIRSAFSAAYGESLMRWNRKHAEALAWSGADLILSDGLMRASRQIAERFPPAGAASSDGGGRLAESDEPPALEDVIGRAVALHVSRGVGLDEGMLSAYFEAVMVTSLRGSDPAARWDEMVSGPEAFFSKDFADPVATP